MNDGPRSWHPATDLEEITKHVDHLDRALEELGDGYSIERRMVASMRVHLVGRLTEVQGAAHARALRRRSRWLAEQSTPYGMGREHSDSL